MAKYLVETYYTCTFKVNHYLDDINESELKNLEKRDDDDKNRFNSPLKPADDAFCIDSTSISPEKVAKIALNHIKKEEM